LEIREGKKISSRKATFLRGDEKKRGGSDNFVILTMLGFGGIFIKVPKA